MKQRILLLVAVAMLAACASSGGRSALYQREIGNASMIDAMRTSHLILERHHYEVNTQDTIPTVRIETHWRPRPPVADEAALGITHAETRLIITARPRGASEDFGALHNVRLIVENRVRVAGGVDWNESTNTPQFREYADRITADFKQEFTNIGVRRF